MMEQSQQNDLAKIDALEVETLSDEELEAVAGGSEELAGSYSCSCCAATATSHDEV